MDIPPGMPVPPSRPTDAVASPFSPSAPATGPGSAILPRAPSGGTEKTLTLEEIAQAFEGRLPPQRVSFFYQIGLLFVAAAMVLLPLVYIGIVGATAAGVAYHAVHNTSMLDANVSGRAKAGVFLAYVAPMVAGVILVLFMIKPLFAKRARIFRTIPLERDEEPTVFAFVQAICRQVKAPAPKEIMVDCDVNAAAGFRRGLVSFFSNDLRLVIGLPLVAGLSLRELSGVLAHEFGHFSQGTAMRFTYVIRSVNAWFARVVYERDVWDVRLEVWAKSIDIRIGIVLHFARFAVWLTRRVLWVLMHIGHGLSCFLLRQMEYDADQYEIALAGSASFETTARRMRVLSVAYEAVHYDLQESWRERRLGDDFPTLVAERAREFKPGLLEKIDEKIQSTKTGLFDTHPSDRARIAQAAKRQAPGVFLSEAPARAIFRDYPKVARMTSIFYYTEMLGSQFRPDQLASTEALIAHRRRMEAEEKSRVEYFGRVFSSVFPLEFPDEPLAPPDDPQDAVRTLREARQRMFAEAPAANVASREFRAAYERMLNARRGRAAREAGFKIDASSFNLPAATREAADQVIHEAEMTMNRQRPVLESFAEVARRRLTAGLRLLLLPQVQERLADEADPPAEIRRLHETLVRLSWGLSFVRDLEGEFLTQAILLQNLDGNEEVEGLMARVRRGLSACHQHLKHIYASFQSEPYPFEHSEGRISIARYVMGEAPMHESGREVVPKSQSTLENFHALYGRLLARLAHHARHLEKLMGYQNEKMPTLQDEED